MACTDINSEDRLVQATFADHLESALGWESIYACNQQTFGPDGTLGRKDTHEVVLVRDLRAALFKLNPELPPAAIADAVAALDDAIAEVELFLRQRGFEPNRLIGAKGWMRISALADAVEAVNSPALAPAGGATSATPASGDKPVGADQAQGLTVDLSRIDLEKLRDEFAKKVKHKATAIEEIFAKLMALSKSMDDEQRCAVREGLSESELAIFDLMQKTTLAATERERIKQSSRELLAELLRIIAPLDQWTEKEQTRAEVQTVILDQVFLLPEPPYTPTDKDAMAKMLFEHVWQQSMGGRIGGDAPRAGTPH